MSKAAKKNPLLEPLGILIGKWKTKGNHPLLPGIILNGTASFEWIENGAFLLMRSHIDHPDFPDGLAIFGSDDSQEAYTMMWFDERNVSRKYSSTLQNKVWKWWRDDNQFSQRFTGEIRDNGNTIISKGEMSKDGKAWEKDLDLEYTRISE